MQWQSAMPWVLVCIGAQGHQPTFHVFWIFHQIFHTQYNLFFAGQNVNSHLFFFKKKKVIAQRRGWCYRIIKDTWAINAKPLTRTLLDDPTNKAVLNGRNPGSSPRSRNLQATDTFYKQMFPFITSSPQCSSLKPRPFPWQRRFLFPPPVQRLAKALQCMKANKQNKKKNISLLGWNSLKLWVAIITGIFV